MARCKLRVLYILHYLLVVGEAGAFFLLGLYTRDAKRVAYSGHMVIKNEYTFLLYSSAVFIYMLNVP